MIPIMGGRKDCCLWVGEFSSFSFFLATFQWIGRWRAMSFQTLQIHEVPTQEQLALVSEL